MTSENYLMMYCRYSGTPATVLRATNPYRPGQ
jgi:nucleoside-diphosphate-sugar epimerase